MIELLHKVSAEHCSLPEPPSIHCCRAELRFRMAGNEPVTPLGAETTVAVLEPAQISACTDVMM